MTITPGLSDRGDHAKQMRGKNGLGFAPDDRVDEMSERVRYTSWFEMRFFD